MTMTIIDGGGEGEGAQHSMGESRKGGTLHHTSGTLVHIGIELFVEPRFLEAKLVTTPQTSLFSKILFNASKSLISEEG
jgi:hypothetical protein